MEKQNGCCLRTFIGILVLGSIIICLIASVFTINLMADREVKKQADALATENAILATESFIAKVEPSSTPTQEMIEQEIEIAYTTLSILQTEQVPENDALDLAARFEGISDSPVQQKEPAVIQQNGVKQNFWILNVNENQFRQITAKLVYQTAHLYFWIEDGVAYKNQEVIQLANEFESQIYPTNRSIFGSEWTPGVDNDDHLTIVYARGLGGASGYFSSTDSLMTAIKPYSNTAEMFYLSADYAQLNSSFTYGVLAHEFQHMIHWNQDHNEFSWVNEGLSELAVDLNDFNVGGFDYMFAFNPDLQLTFWPGDDQGDSAPHYGASYLFFKYLFTRFGQEIITDTVLNSKDGMVGIDAVLKNYMSESSAVETTDLGDQIFQDWTIANVLQDAEFQNGIYSYGNEAGLPTFYPGEELTCDSTWKEGAVSQYGTDYIKINCDDDFSIELEGDSEINLFPVDPHSGQYYFWSNIGDESDMRLTRKFDFTDTSAPITISYWAWFDIESDYDYVYLSASSDGEKWEILEPSTCTTNDPTGANYGCGYNGKSQGWINEMVDLSKYAGKKITLRFEYVTDAAVNNDGFLLDDITIDAIRYSSDFETNEGGWNSEGFVRIGNDLPQTFAVTLIEKNTENRIHKWISEDGLDQSIQAGEDGKVNEAILVISGMTRYTRLPASYKIKISKTE